MNLLFYDWGSYLYEDLADIFRKKGIRFRSIRYRLADKNYDEKFEQQLTGELQNGTYDAVFSINYFPIVAQCCYRRNIRYISWSYDNPLNVRDIEKTLGLATNRVFLFDRLQAKKYQDAGFEHIYHLPLAVHTERYRKLQLTREEAEQYAADISFVGSLYESQLGLFTSQMNEYQKGYIDGICNVQEKLYGCYVIDEMLTDSFMASIHEQFRKNNPDTGFVLPREALSYAMATSVTHRERLLLLTLLSKRHKVSLYSADSSSLLRDCVCHGRCDYYTQMPLIFKASGINLNITLKCLQSGIPLRALDIMACGGFLLTNYQEEIMEHFLPGEEVVLYESVEDAVGKADYYLKHEDIRRRIAANGFARVQQDFSMEKRLETLFG